MVSFSHGSSLATGQVLCGVYLDNFTDLCDRAGSGMDSTPLVDVTQLSKVDFYKAPGKNVAKSCPSSVTPPSSPLVVDGDDDSDSRPPHSYVRIVILALLDCPGRQGTIKEIYNQITRKFPYYKENRLHWKNSVRHNLTVFRCFQRIPVPGSGAANARTTNLWKLIGDWESILQKAESLPPRKPREISVDAYSKKKKLHKSSRADKLKIQSKKEREIAKRKRRLEKARKYKVKPSIRVIDRVPLSEFNYSPPGPQPDEAPQPRMPTPPVRLPGIENVFLPPPAQTISPLKETNDLWADSLELTTLHGHYLTEQVAYSVLGSDTVHGQAMLPSEQLSTIEPAIDGSIDQWQSNWFQLTPEQSPTKAWTALSKAGLSGYASSSTGADIISDPIGNVDMDIDAELLGMFTQDLSWLTSMVDAQQCFYG